MLCLMQGEGGSGSGLEVLTVSSQTAVAFVCVASGMLLVMFFFLSKAFFYVLVRPAKPRLGPSLACISKGVALLHLQQSKMVTEHLMQGRICSALGLQYNHKYGVTFWHQLWAAVLDYHGRILLGLCRVSAPSDAPCQLHCPASALTCWL